MLNTDDSPSDSTGPENVLVEDSLHEPMGVKKSTGETEMTQQEDSENYPTKRHRSKAIDDSFTDSSTINNHISTLPRGLQNLGNTCFMNSALQCLCRSPAIQEYFINNEEIIFEGFSAKFAHLVREVNSDSMLAFAPWSFKQAISEKDARFGGYEQQDAQELAIVLLDAIHEDQKSTASEGSIIEDPKLDEWQKYIAREDTIVSRNFHGLFKSVITCGACGKESVAFDPFASLSLPISSPPRETFRVFRISGNVLVQGVVRTSDDWIFKDGLYYEPLPDSSFYSFYAECNLLTADTSIELGNDEVVNVCKVSKPFLLPTSTPLEFLRSRLGAVYPDVELDWSQELIQCGDKFIFRENLINKLNPDGDALDDIKEFFETLFKETPTGEEFEHHQSTSLAECLNSFERAEPLAPNTWYCPNCKSRPDSASKQMHLHVLPLLLLIQLKRFEFNAWGGSRKLTRLVTYPETLEIDDQSFELYGVVEHFGSLFSGHYTARVKCGGKWYNFDDSYVSPVSGAVNSRNAYLLFYARSNNDQ